MLGAVAQLGERLLCKQEVVGSIPIGSTILRASDGSGSGGKSLRLWLMVKGCGWSVV